MRKSQMLSTIDRVKVDVRRKDKVTQSYWVRRDNKKHRRKIQYRINKLKKTNLRTKRGKQFLGNFSFFKPMTVLRKTRAKVALRVKAKLKGVKKPQELSFFFYNEKQKRVFWDRIRLKGNVPGKMPFRTGQKDYDMSEVIKKPKDYKWESVEVFEQYQKYRRGKKRKRKKK